jgi:hypothetical protein
MGDTKPYYRQDDIIYDHHNEKINSRELQNKILNDLNVKYYDFNDIINYIDSIPVFVNIMYTDDVDFQSTYAIFSTDDDEEELIIITMEDLNFDLESYIPYECFLLSHPSFLDLPGFDVMLSDSLTNSENRVEISECPLEITHMTISPIFKATINPKTGFPHYILYHGLHVKLMEFQEFFDMYQKKKIYNYCIDNEIQKWNKYPNKLFIVFGTNGITYLLNAQYNKKKNMIYPPL